jgi:hypothetical protein
MSSTLFIKLPKRYQTEDLRMRKIVRIGLGLISAFLAGPIGAKQGAAVMPPNLILDSQNIDFGASVLNQKVMLLRGGPRKPAGKGER